MKHHEMTLPALQEIHADMLATVSDLGMDPPANMLGLFETVEAGAPICDALHAAIEKHRAEEKPADKNARLKERRLAKEVAVAAKTEQTAALPDTKKGRALAKRAANKPQQPKKEKTVAKKAKKSVAKKVVAKASAFDDNAKITWLLAADKGAGCREGSAKHARHDIVRRFHGKTVKAYLAAKGSGGVPTLAACVTAKKARVA